MCAILQSFSYHQLLTLVPRRALVTFKWAVEAHVALNMDSKAEPPRLARTGSI